MCSSFSASGGSPTLELWASKAATPRKGIPKKAVMVATAPTAAAPYPLPGLGDICHGLLLTVVGELGGLNRHPPHPMTPHPIAPRHRPSPAELSVILARVRSHGGGRWRGCFPPGSPGAAAIILGQPIRDRGKLVDRLELVTSRQGSHGLLVLRVGGKRQKALRGGRVGGERQKPLGRQRGDARAFGRQVGADARGADPVAYRGLQRRPRTAEQGKA